MLCDECQKREAVFHSKVIKNGVVKTRHLCAQCSKKYREEDSFLKNFDGIDDLFSSFAGLMLGDSAPSRAVCMKCGTTADEFLKTGYVGCGECDKAFENIMTPAIRRIHHDVRHVGKIPGGKSEAALAGKIENLRRLQQKAIDSENYEEASRLRDEIIELKKSMEGGDGNER